MAARRATILLTARAMLTERAVSDISLRELSDRVGLAKSNVLRYFESREAVFLEVLDAEWSAWLDALQLIIGVGPTAATKFVVEEHVASVVSSSLAARPLLCELVSAMAGVLERNISLDYARSVRRRGIDNTNRLARLVRAQLPMLTVEAAQHFSAATFIIIAGMWPYNTPSETIAKVTVESGMHELTLSFESNLCEALTNLLVGLVARTNGAHA